MATLLNVDLVKYVCSCGQWSPLSRQYFCRHCVSIRCGFCVCHEVDSVYCANCLENLPNAEARLKKNRCGNCFDCPCCGHSLSVRATSAAGQLAAPAEVLPPGTVRKVYYLACSFCRWTSRDAGIPDQNVASGSWPELENPHSKILASITDHFRSLAAVEKAERERKRFTTKRRTYMPWTDKFGLSTILAKKRAGLPISTSGTGGINATEPPTSGTGSIDDTGQQKYQIYDQFIQASEEVEPFPEELLTKPIQLESICTVQERHSQPEFQPEMISQLYPVRKQLMIKRSQRCKQCDHNLCKAEYTASSIKFKIQLSALYHVPEIRLLQPPAPLHQLGQETDILLSITNLSGSQMHIMLLPDVNAPDTLEPTLPMCEFVLPARDEPNEIIDDGSPAMLSPGSGSAQMQQFQDDRTVVVFRRGHKIGIKMPVKKIKESATNLLQFLIKYDYINTVLQLTGEQNQPQTVWRQQPVCVNLSAAETIIQSQS